MNTLAVQEPEQQILIAENRLRTLADLRDDVEGAAEVVTSVAFNLHALNRADVYQRYILGSQLEIVRDNGLWQSIAPAGEEVKSTQWDEWLRNEFREITGLSAETAYGACQIAKAQFLQQRDEDEIRELGKLGNVRLLARVERQGTPITDQMLNDAQTLSEKEFRQRVGLPETSRRFEAIVDKPEEGPPLEWFLGVRQSCDPDSFDSFVKNAKELFHKECGENATDLFDCMAAMILEYLQTPERHQDTYDEIDMLLKKEDNDEYYAR